MISLSSHGRGALSLSLSLLLSSPAFLTLRLQKEATVRSFLMFLRPPSRRHYNFNRTSWRIYEFRRRPPDVDEPQPPTTTSQKNFVTELRSIFMTKHKYQNTHLTARKMSCPLFMMLRFYVGLNQRDFDATTFYSPKRNFNKINFSNLFLHVFFGFFFLH